jgi:hypothetical protein
VKAVFWNPVVPGKVSRSAEYGRIQAHGVGTAGAPKRVKQDLVEVCKVCI